MKRLSYGIGLAAGDAQYDVIVASNYYVPRLIASGLIQPLDKVEIPNKAAKPDLKLALKPPLSRPSAAGMRRLHYTALKGDALQFVQQLWSEVQSR